MQRGSVYCSSLEGIEACFKDLELKQHGVEFGEVIHYTNPPCIDCRWPLERDNDVQNRLKELDSKFQPVPKPTKTYTLTTRNSGQHE